MQKYFEILRKCPLFNNIDNTNLISMMRCLSPNLKKYKKNTTITEEGSDAKYIGIVLKGEAYIEHTDYFGNRSIVTHIEPSEMFGESYACSGSFKIPFDIIASKDTEVLFFDCQKIISQCKNSCDFHNKMIFNLLKIVASKNITLTQKSLITSKRTTREKLLSYLFMQAKKNNSSDFTIPFDRQQLADYLEVDRSGLSNEISKLRNEGVIESKRSRFKLFKTDL